MIDKAVGWIVWVIGGAGVLFGGLAMWLLVRGRRTPPEPPKTHRTIDAHQERAAMDHARQDVVADAAELERIRELPIEARGDALSAELNRRRR